MPNEVEITLQVVDKASDELIQFEKSLGTLRKELAAQRPELSKNKEDLDDLMVALYGGTGATDDFAKATKEAKKETGDFGKQLLQIGKGLVGVSGLFMLGRAMKSFVSDSMEAAKEAGKLPAVFDAAAEAGERLQVAVGTKLGRAFAPVVEATKTAKENMAEQLENEEKIQKAIEQGLITRKEAELTGHSYLQRTEQFLQILELIVQREQERLDLVKQTVEASATLTHEERNRGELARRAAWEDKQRVQEALDAAQEATMLLPVSIFEDIDPGLLSKIQATLDLIDRQQIAGAERIKQEYDVLLKKLEEGAGILTQAQISAIEQGLTRLEEQQMVVDIVAQAEAGEITTAQAEAAIRDILGIPLAEASTLLTDIMNGLDALAGKHITITIDIDTDLPDIITGGGGNGGDDGGPVSQPEGPDPTASLGGLGGTALTVGTMNVTTSDPTGLVDALIEELA